MSFSAMPASNPDRSGNNPIEMRDKSSSQPAWHWYQSFGLSIRSQIELPEFSRIDARSAGQDLVDIILGDVPMTLKGARREAPWLQASTRQCVVESANIARFLVEDGTRITVDRRVQAAQEALARDGDVRAYLLGTVFGALLHQRQWLPLHISAVKSKAGIVAFTGPSGVGKSTLAASLHYQMNLPLVSDDIAILKPDDSEPLLYPGPPRLKLWNDAVQSLGIDRVGLIRDLSREDKFHIRQNLDSHQEPEPLRRLVILKKADPGQPPTVRRILGIEAYRAFMHAIYRPSLCGLFFDQTRLHDFGGKMARMIEVYEYRRPWGLAAVEPSLRKMMTALRLNEEG